MSTIPVVVQINPSDMVTLTRLVEHYGTIEAAISALLSFASNTRDPREYVDRADWSFSDADEVTVYTCFGKYWYVEPVQLADFDIPHPKGRGRIGAMEMPEDLARSIKWGVEMALTNYCEFMGTDRKPTWGELRSYAWKHYYPGAVKFDWGDTDRLYRDDNFSRFLGLELPEVLATAAQAEPIEHHFVTDFIANWDAATYLTVRAYLGERWHTKTAEVTPKLAARLGENVRRFRHELKKALEAYTERRIINIHKANPPTWAELHFFLYAHPVAGCLNLGRFLGLELLAAEQRQGSR